MISALPSRRRSTEPEGTWLRRRSRETQEGDDRYAGNVYARSTDSEAITAAYDLATDSSGTWRAECRSGWSELPEQVALTR